MPAADALKWGVSHDPFRVGDRTPLGAVEVGVPVRVVLRVGGEARESVEAVDVLVTDGVDSWRLEADPREGGFACVIELPHRPHAAFYCFELSCADGETRLYVPRTDGRSTSGELVAADEGGGGFQISVHEPGFTTPEWLAGAVMYQVFPDRFARGAGGVRDEGLAAHRAMGRPVRLREEWDTPLRWWTGKGYDPCEFFGGTLEGIREKLAYFASLGVEVLYLNPVLEARSYHRYDTADYERIDPLLGTNDDLALLAVEAREYGISIILDAVLSHTGDDSRYFNAYGRYAEPGAAQGAASPFHSWYDFTENGEGGAPYRCWWGDPSLPEVEERDPSWQHYIFGTVLPGWLAVGARGYRLDVADEIPDDVLSALRTAVKGANGEAAIIGEVWEDATTKESYGEQRTYALGTSLDSVMNYPLREALIGFATGALDAYQLATFLKLQQANYPEPLYRCLMNLLSSHDVERIRTVLALGGPIRDLPRTEQERLTAAITPERDERAARFQEMLAGIVYALPGAPCIYYGDERGLQGGGDPFCRAPMVWGNPARNDYGADLTDFYRALGMLRKNSQALRVGEMACQAIDADSLCILRWHGADEPAVLALVNRTETEKRAVVDLSALSGRRFAGILRLRATCSAQDEGKVGAFHPVEDDRASLEDGIATMSVSACSTAFFALSEEYNRV